MKDAPPGLTSTASFIDRVAEAPHRYDLFQALRRIEGAHPERPRFGDAPRPSDEPIRFTQEASLTFAPAAIAGIERHAGQTPRLVQRIFGLLGPNGPLPIHLTEYVRERHLHHADPTLQRFIDTLVHRFGLLFYRAWARAQPVTSLDRSDDNRTDRHLGAIAGLGEPGTRQRDAVQDGPKLFFAGRLARSVRDADGLRAWLAAHFGVPIRIEQFSGHWMALERDERSLLTRHGQQGLGRGAVLGAQVWDVQHKFRIVVGPLDWAGYCALLPDRPALNELRAMVRQYLGFEFAWDLQLVLRAGEAPPWKLARPHAVGKVGSLGRTAWLGRVKADRDNADRDHADLCMNVETLLHATPI